VQDINTLHTFLIVDACFSGSLLRGTRGSTPRPPRSEQYKSRRIFASGQHNEVVPDGEKGDNSPFARSILNELRNNTNRYVPASKLIAEVSIDVQSESKQVPVDDRLKDSGDEGGDFIFHLRLSESDIWEAVLKLESNDAYENFNTMFPNSAHVDEAAWRIAEKVGTRKSTMDYMKKYPQGEFREHAIKLLEFLEEEAAWGAAKSRNVLSGYYRYIKDYPIGKYVRDAQEIIEKLLGEEDDSLSGESPEEERKLNPPGPSLDEPVALNDINWLNTLRRRQGQPKNERIKLLKQLIEKCSDYLQKYPGTNQYTHVKQILDDAKIELRGM
jgi:hypothetical protein